MAWKATFDKGVACFKRGDLEQALIHMSQAAEHESSAFIIYDSRAAVHERLGNLKAALLDSKRVIDLAPDQWQGYARSARLFHVLGKYGSTIKMVDHAFTRLRSGDVQRHAQLAELREKAVVAQAATEKGRSSQSAQTWYLLGKLPVETLAEIFMMLIDEDHTWAIKLSHVCGHWRRIIINTPSAWQTLVLSKKHPLRKVELWKQRSKARIARISIVVTELDRAPVFGELRDLSWDYVRSLQVFQDDFVDLCHMLCDISVPHAFSKLGELILLDGAASDRILTLSCFTTEINWKLETLRFNGPIFLADGWWERIRNLKELHLSGKTRYLSQQVFIANRSLERLALDCPSDPVFDRDADSSPTIMNNLEVVECRGSCDPFHILRSIVAPSITHFTMFSRTAAADATLLHMASRPSLVELHIGNCSLSPTTLPSVLSSTPNLEALRVNAVLGVVNELFQFLTPKTLDAEHELPCRALKHIDVSRCTDLTTSSVYALLKTRVHYASESTGPADKCAVVESLKVDGCPKIESDMLPWFRSQVMQLSCVYATRKDFRKDYRR